MAPESPNPTVIRKHSTTSSGHQANTGVATRSSARRGVTYACRRALLHWALCWVQVGLRSGVQQCGCLADAFKGPWVCSVPSLMHGLLAAGYLCYREHGPAFRMMHTHIQPGPGGNKMMKMWSLCQHHSSSFSLSKTQGHLLPACPPNWFLSNYVLPFSLADFHQGRALEWWGPLRSP